MPIIDPEHKLRRTELELKDVGLNASVPSIGLCRTLNDSHEQWTESAVAFTREHTHGEHIMEIHYVAKGRQVWQFEGKDYRVSGDELFFAFPGERHGIGQHRRERSQTYWLQIRVNPKARSFLGFSRAVAKPVLDGLLETKQRGRVFKASRQVQHLFDDVFAGHDRPKAVMRPLVMSLKLWILIVEILQCVEREPAKYESEDIAFVLKYIDEHLEDGTSLTGPELADHADLSRSWFQEKFRQETGMTPSDYVNFRKIERAKELLTGGKHNVTDVAFRLGYSSSQGFATIFKRYTNKRPSDFLRRE